MHTGCRTLSILGYHKVGPPSPGAWQTWYYVSQEVFVRQLACLRDEGWCVIDAAAFLRGLAEPESLPHRSALLTFDDGYRCVLQFALPCLQQFRYPAVVFVPTAFVGSSNSFDHNVEPVEPILDWDELCELDRSRISVQSHGVFHRAFSELPLLDQQRELQESKARLESQLNKSVEIFSYPYGDSGSEPNATARILAQFGYKAACLYKGGPVRLPAADIYCLNRIPMGPDTDLHDALAAA